MEKTLDMSVFPNPNDGRFSVQIQAQSSQNLVLETLDGTRRVLETVQLTTGEDGWLKIEPDWTNLPSGVYLLRLRAGEETRFEKIVKI